MNDLSGGGSATAARWAPSIYFVVGQVGWFACVLSAARGVPWIGLAVAIVLIAAHLLRIPRPLDELKFLLSVTVLGAVWESVLVWFGLLAYASGTLVQGTAPYWIVALWALFAAQFNTTYGWLKPRMAIAAVLGAIAGPLSFRAGAALHALRFVRPWPAAVALALGWSVLLPTLIVLSKRWDGVRSAQGSRAVDGRVQ